MNTFVWCYKTDDKFAKKIRNQNIISLVLTYGTKTLVELIFDVPSLSIKVVDYFTPATYTVRIKDICGYDATAIKELIDNAKIDFNEKTANLYCGIPSITQTRKSVIDSIYHNFYQHSIIKEICTKYVEEYLMKTATFSEEMGKTNLTGTVFDKADDATREAYAYYLIYNYIILTSSHHARYLYGPKFPVAVKNQVIFAKKSEHYSDHYDYPHIKYPTEPVAFVMLYSHGNASNYFRIDDKKAISKTNINIPIDDFSEDFKCVFLERTYGRGISLMTQTPELQKYALECAGKDKAIWKSLVNPTLEVTLCAAEQNPALIKNLNLTDEQIFDLFSKNRDIAKYISNPSLKLQKKLVNVWRRYKKGVDATYKYDDHYHPHDPEDYPNHHATLGADITKTFKVWNGVYVGNLKNPAPTLVRAITRLGSLVDVKQHMNMVRESDILAGLRTYDPRYTLEGIDDARDKHRVINEKYVMYAIKHMPVDNIPAFAAWLIHRYSTVPDKILKALAKKNYMSLGYINGLPRKYGNFVKSYDITKSTKLTNDQIIETVKNSMRPDATGFEYVQNPSKDLVLALCEWTGRHIQYLDKVDDAYQLEIINALQGGGLDMSKSSYLPSAVNWLYLMPEYIKDITDEAKALVEKYEAENKAYAEAREKAEHEAYQARQKAEEEQRKLDYELQQRLATIEDGDMV